ncbi:MAG TPA: AbrB/MazE/SpoVT family DNA-binding domain-containing protein [Terracidiphilus sp.]
MASQPTTLTSKGQVTIPKRIRESLNLGPGSRVVFDVNEQGDIVLRREDGAKPRPRIRLDEVIGSAQIKWNGTTDEYMEMIRGYSDDPR